MGRGSGGPCRCPRHNRGLSAARARPLSGSLSSVPRGSSTMTPLFRRYYGAPGGSPRTTARLCLCTSAWTPTAARTGNQTRRRCFSEPASPASPALSVRLKRSRSSSSSRPRPTETRPLARLTPPGGVQNSDPFGPTLPSEIAGVARAPLDSVNSSRTLPMRVKVISLPVSQPQ